MEKNIFLKEENEKLKNGMLNLLKKKELFTYKCG